MNWHVEVIRLEWVGHVSKGLKAVASAGLLKTKRNRRFAAFLKNKVKDGKLGWKQATWNSTKPVNIILERQISCPQLRVLLSGFRSPVVMMRVWSSPELSTWDISSHLWEHREGEESDSRCGNCHHSHHTTADDPHHFHQHRLSTCSVPPMHTNQQ